MPDFAHLESPKLISRKIWVIEKLCDLYLFSGTSTLQHLQATLEGQPLYVELLQEVNPGHGPGSQTVLATFETSGLEFLFPYPQLRPTYTSGVDVDLLMEPTRDFPGIISPKVGVYHISKYSVVHKYNQCYRS